MIKLGVDVGGTFTDLVVFDERDGTIRLTKVPSTPRSPDEGVLNGIRRLAAEFAIDAAAIDFFIHGTTVATNALIERKGVKAALLTTAGFRDVLHIGRQTRPKLYDFFEQRPDPLIPRHLRFEVPERMLYTGEVHQPLDDAAVTASPPRSGARTSAWWPSACCTRTPIRPTSAGCASSCSRSYRSSRSRCRATSCLSSRNTSG